MAYLLTAACVVAFLSVPQESGAQDAVRFAPLQADQLTPEQKKWEGYDHSNAAPRVNSPSLVLISAVSN
jgi:hypothetical protein